MTIFIIRLLDFGSTQIWLSSFGCLLPSLFRVAAKFLDPFKWFLYSFCSFVFATWCSVGILTSIFHISFLLQREPRLVFMKIIGCSLFSKVVAVFLSSCMLTSTSFQFLYCKIGVNCDDDIFQTNYNQSF